MYIVCNTGIHKFWSSWRSFYKNMEIKDGKERLLTAVFERKLKRIGIGKCLFVANRKLEKLYNPIYEIFDESEHHAEECGPPDRLCCNFAGRNSFLALFGYVLYVPETEMSVLAFARNDAMFTTRILLTDPPMAEEVNVTQNTRKYLLFFFWSVWKRYYQMFEKR